MRHATDDAAASVRLKLVGLPLNIPAARALMDELDWSQVWPEVDHRGRLTGQMLDSDADVILVDWDGRQLTTRHGHACEACIRRCHAPARLVAEDLSHQ